MAEPNQKHIITMYNKKNANLGTHARRIIKRAGFEPWPKTFQNLRSSRETELVEDFPVHVVTAWLGNTPKVAEKHYLQVTEEHFRRASTTARNTAQHTAEKKSNCSQGAERRFYENYISADTCETLQALANFCINKDLHSAPERDYFANLVKTVTHLLKMSYNSRQIASSFPKPLQVLHPIALDCIHCA